MGDLVRGVANDVVVASCPECERPSWSIARHDYETRWTLQGIEGLWRYCRKHRSPYNRWEDEKWLEL